MKNNTHSTGTELSLQELLALSGIPNAGEDNINLGSVFNGAVCVGQMELPVEEVVSEETKSASSPVVDRKTCRLSESIIRRILADKMDSPKIIDLSIIYLTMDKTAAEVFYKGIFFYGEISLVEELRISLLELHISFELVVPTYSIHMKYNVAVNGKVKQTYPTPVVREERTVNKPKYTVVFKCGEKAWFHDFYTLPEINSYLRKKNYVALASHKNIWMKGGGHFAKVEGYLPAPAKKNYKFKK